MCLSGLKYFISRLVIVTGRRVGFFLRSKVYQVENKNLFLYSKKEKFYESEDEDDVDPVDEQD